MQVGQKIQMVSHSWYPVLSERVSGVREVVKVQTNGVQFSGGSWLYWPRASWIYSNEEGFRISLTDESFDESMTYEWR